jgi:hypothetical protein
MPAGKISDRITVPAMLRNTRAVLPLILVAVLGYWQVSFFVFGLKWDLIDVVFPFRYHFSQCIQSGFFPFWNPYQQTGAPFFADLQVPFFNPELLYISLFTGYSVYTMHILFIAYASIAATGMYRLACHFNRNPAASLFAGLSYLLGGFMIGHGQHFFLLVGAAWLPHVILNYLRLNETGHLIYVLKTAVFIFLMISGAYQAMSFVLFYLLLILFLYYLANALYRRAASKLLRTLKLNLFLAFTVFAFSFPMILAAFEILPFVTRLSEGVNPESLPVYGQALTSLLSLLLPYATVQDPGFFGGVDPSMLNHHIGLIAVVFLLPGILNKRQVPEYLILGFGIIILASSFRSLPVREFMFDHIPFMDKFKYAAYTRVFGMMALILIASGYFAYFMDNFRKERGKVIASAGAVSLALLALLTFSLLRGTANAVTGSKTLNEWLEAMTFHHRMLLQVPLQVLVLSLFMLVLFRYQRLKNPALVILLLSGIELFSAAQLNMFSTVADREHRARHMQRDIALYPQGFPLPVDGKILYNDRQHACFAPFWRNTYIFSKQVAFQSFSSFELNTYSKLDDEFHNLRQAVLDNHLFYFSDTILPLGQMDDDAIDPGQVRQILYLQDEDYARLAGLNLASDGNDRLEILEFGPNSVRVETRTRSHQLLSMLQSNYKGWKAYIDEEETPIYTSNFNYRTILLPAGTHSVRFEYRNSRILVSYIVAHLHFAAGLVFLLIYWLRSLKLRGWSLGFISLLCILIAAFFLLKRLKFEDPDLSTEQLYHIRWPEEAALFHYRQDFEEKSSARSENDTVSVFSDGFSLRIEPGTEYRSIISIPNAERRVRKGTLVVRAKMYNENYKEILLVSVIKSGETSRDWHAAKLNRQIEGLEDWNHLVYFRNLYRLKENDHIEVYIWNPERTGLRLDDIEVLVFPQKSRYPGRTYSSSSSAS